MRIRVLRNLGKDLPPYAEGQVVDADAETSARLIESGLAEPAKLPAGLKALTPAPERLEGVTPPDATLTGDAAESDGGGKRKKK